MRVRALKTDLVTAHADLSHVLDRHVDDCPEGSVLAVTSKIVALCQGRVADPAQVDKETLIEREASHFLPATASRYHVSLTITQDRMVPTAGIDQSNAHGKLILWPDQAQVVANQIRDQLSRRLGLRSVGVIITDSTTAPLRRGVVGICIAHSGFRALHDYVGKPDLFGRALRMTQANVAEGLAAAVMLMGEAAERTPLAMLTELPFIDFQDRDPPRTNWPSCASPPSTTWTGR